MNVLHDNSSDCITPTDCVDSVDFIDKSTSASNVDDCPDVSPHFHSPSHISPSHQSLCNSVVTPPVVTQTDFTASDSEPLPAMTTIPNDDIDVTSSIDLNRNNMVLALLPNREKMLTLFDSGASDSLVCATFVQQSKYLSKLPKISVPVHKFKVGNGEYVTSKYAMEIPIKIQNHQFVIRALAIDTLGGIDLVIGSPALREIDACLEFKQQRLRFRHTTFIARLTRSLTLQPGEVRIVNVSARIPAFLRNATLFLRTSKFMSQFTASNMLLKFHHGFATIVLRNPLNRTFSISHEKTFAIIDLRYLTKMYSPIFATAMSSTDTQLLCYSAMHSTDAPCAKNVSPSVQQNNPVDRKELYDQKSAKYPFLDETDSRLQMTDEEIVNRDIIFATTPLNVTQQQQVKDLLLKYKDALSLHSEVGDTNLTIDFNLTDDSPFYIRPFTVSASEKPIIDRELQKLVQMGILKEEHSAYSSPVMLLRKKGTTDLRLVTDFRHLNTKIVRRNLPFPLIREAIHTIGQARPMVVSVLDLKQAYHCLNLSPRCQDYCGITSYFGGKSYKYLRLPMGLSASPCVFQQHINSILDSAQARDFCIGIMDDLIIFSDSISAHFQHLETILHALSDNGLKISPSKAKLFRTRVVYMGHEIVINKQQQGIRPLRDRTEAIRKLPVPTTKRQLKGFIGKVSYLSMYLPKLQLLLQPLHKISSKNAVFKWTEEHQQAFNAILELLVKPPILSLPRSQGLFRLYVDTSRLGVGASLWQIQDGQERLLAYFSKSLPQAARHYGISELEFTGISYAVSAFRHLLKNTEFEVYTDHASIPQIMKSKAEPSTDRIKRLLEKLSGYAIKIGFRKGSTMVIADYLSRNPIPSDPTAYDIAFPMLTRGLARSSDVRMPTVRQTVDSQTSKQVYKAPVPPPAPAPHMPPPASVAPPVVQPQAPVAPPAPVPHVPQPAEQPIPRPTAAELPTASTPQVDHSETHTPPPPTLLRQPKPLDIQWDETITKHLPKQKDIDKFLEKLDKARLQSTHLPYEKRELAKLQSLCPNFKDIYAYIHEGLLPGPKSAAKKILAQSEHFVMIDSVLFRLPAQESSNLQVAIPQSIVHEILFIYHDSLLACHQGIARVTATIRQKFYFPNMHQLITNYIRSCRICQSRKHPVDAERPFHLNIPTEYVPFETVFCDLKTMPPSSQNHKYLLVLVCNITRYTILAPLINKDAVSVAEAILQKCIFQFGPFKQFVSDQGREWDNSVISYIFDTLKIQQRFVSVGNHKSNKSERFISTVSSLLTSYLTNNGRNWHLFANSVSYAYNSFASPALGNYSPFYLVYLRHPPTAFVCSPPLKVSIGYQDYIQLLIARLQMVGKIMLDIQAKLQHQQAAAQNRKVKNPPVFAPGMLVYLLAPSASALQIASRKLRLDFIGPFVVKEILDRSHVILKTLDNKQLPTIIHVSRLKPAWIRCGLDSVNTITDFLKHTKVVPSQLKVIMHDIDTPKTDLDRSTTACNLQSGDYTIRRLRYKLGTLQALLHTSDTVKTNLWISLPVESQLTDLTIPTVGSLHKFAISLL